MIQPLTVEQRRVALVLNSFIQCTTLLPLMSKKELSLLKLHIDQFLDRSIRQKEKSRKTRALSDSVDDGDAVRDITIAFFSAIETYQVRE